MSGENVLEQIEEARRVVTELGGKETRTLEELKTELDRMIEASKAPDYSPDDREILQQKRALIIDAMETALHTMMNEGMETMASTATSVEESPETATERTAESPAPTQSAFVSEGTTPAPVATSAEAPKTLWQKFLSGAGGFFSSIGTYFKNLWSSWFPKKDETSSPAPAATTETPAPATETTTIPETTTSPMPTAAPTENTPNPAAQKAYDEDPTAPDPGTGSDESIPSSSDTRPETPAPAPNDPSPVPLAPEQPAEAPAITENAAESSTNMIDGQVYDIGGHRMQWTGNADHLFTIDDKKFGIGAGTHLALIGGLNSITKQGDTVIIDSILGKAELDEQQLRELITQVVTGTPVEKTGFLGGTYKSLSVTMSYWSVQADGTRLAKTRTLELLPN